MEIDHGTHREYVDEREHAEDGSTTIETTETYRDGTRVVKEERVNIPQHSAARTRVVLDATDRQLLRAEIARAEASLADSPKVPQGFYAVGERTIKRERHGELGVTITVELKVQSRTTPEWRVLTAKKHVQLTDPSTINKQEGGRV
mmetsp:Transcript_51865/g.127301  ORF Transcript_51865/g.127301 Transcript_51865/m.127301 type:complete len:146 (-) Transcript_51865:77-514(-)|eukprot:CAMPEP_0198339702 /NCGR_PEP_ID=MMETSP1450-20131203/41456_1 /TAXON_ID=753684 ORGANISM="Madagascaria erythrocladiodes, Strain CCMP3234" /NCGR_SAMPLE_ID=MMETSP1450 /ASSEMBLY_ACC=CAM_ASM_001115 /LENGTH=145 /DNA_ID=CAMNT_0044044647 /DNA_START=61 /DNA_END=498 /DNA_ORIENTATION=+